MTKHVSLFALAALLAGCAAGPPEPADALYRVPAGEETRWVSFENPTGAKGAGGQENKGGKGHPYEPVAAGEAKVLLDLQGSGRITRMWITIRDRSPQMLRGLKLEMFWDGADKPAVAAPFGDFFGVGLGRTTAFENEFFANPEGRSFVCHIPMPFRTGAKVVVTNESGKDLEMLFYDIDTVLTDAPDPADLYFHTYWSREQATELGRDFEILPAVEGTGRFLGTNVGVTANPVYGDHWWGEGEVKMYVDGDTDLPTIVGTGTEDYIGTGWGQGRYIHRFQGCSIADPENRQWSFYRYHVPDPVWFRQGIRVTIHQMGGSEKKNVIALLEKGVPLIPVTIQETGRFTRLLDMDPVPDLKDESLHDGWTNYYRSDDVSAAAYFYLDSPVTGLPALAGASARMAALGEEK
jgi:D-arabinan exo alpha-(1,3)/(1,5)-arabinofuranosidase (non-reducing end)